VANPSLARLLVKLQPNPNLALQKLGSSSQSVVFTVFSRKATMPNVLVLVPQVSNALLLSACIV
jgi:hypothetical protein